MVNFNDVLHASETGNPQIVDVREPYEFAAGHIPRSVNIPLGSLALAFDLNAAEFKLQYKIDLPGKEDDLICSCLIGGRAKKAQSVLQGFDYKNVQLYKGSFEDWVANDGKVEKSNEVSFNLVQHASVTGNPQLIDVREPYEFAAGHIPRSVNIPLGSLASALDLNAAEFKLQYKIDLPGKEDDLICSCLIGGRAKKAQSVLQGVGYKNVQLYKGSFEDWVANDGKVEK